MQLAPCWPPEEEEDEEAELEQAPCWVRWPPEEEDDEEEEEMEQPPRSPGQRSLQSAEAAA